VSVKCMQATVHVIATTFGGTRAALAAAVPLAKGSNARLVVIVPRIISYHAELDSQGDSSSFFAKRYQDLVEELGGAASIQVCVCRSLDGIVDLLRATPSTVVVGGPAGRGVTSPEGGFANRVTRLGRRGGFVGGGAEPTQDPGPAPAGRCARSR